MLNSNLSRLITEHRSTPKTYSWEERNEDISLCYKVANLHPPRYILFPFSALEALVCALFVSELETKIFGKSVLDKIMPLSKKTTQEWEDKRREELLHNTKINNSRTYVRDREYYVIKSAFDLILREIQCPLSDLVKMRGLLEFKFDRSDDIYWKSVIGKACGGRYEIYPDDGKHDHLRYTSYKYRGLWWPFEDIVICS